MTWFELASFGNNAGFFSGLSPGALVVGSVILMFGVEECRVCPRWTSFMFLIGMFLVTLGGLTETKSVLGYGLLAQWVRIIGGIFVGCAGLMFARRMWLANSTAAERNTQPG